MSKLVVTTSPLSGRTIEVTAEKTSVGRIEDNQVVLPEASVSSHHCELTPVGDEIFVRDLNSTNGTFINGDQIKEGTLKPGQILRLGVVDLKLETGKKQMDQVRPTGVKIGEGIPAAPVLEKNTAFTKKSNKANKIFIAIAVLLGLAIVAFLVIAFSGVSKPPE
ncbi:MAG: FHA domain-containing protein [Pedosphaera sp.]|nr:FHA domain-containing protein [Pedosphaera sp.]